MTRINDVTGRLWREYADLRRRVTRLGSVSPARSVFGNDRHDLEQWNRVTAQRHQRYRDEFDPPDDAVAIVCVSNRPDRLTDVRNNVLRQLHRPLELVLVLNDPEFAPLDIEVVLRELSAADISVKVIEQPDHTLGSCLNRGMAATQARYVAKFDDDDRYGPAYLDDALRAHTYSGAAVVGKHTHFVLIERSDRLLVRYGGHEFEYTGTLAGGTLVIDRDRTGSIEFPDVSLGEDRGFLRRCHRHGISTFAADRFNYILHRGSDNTWQAPDQQFEQSGMIVGASADTSQVEI